MRRLFTVIILFITIISLIPFNVFAHIEYDPLGHECKWGNEEPIRNNRTPISAGPTLHYIFVDIILHCDCGRIKYVEKDLKWPGTHQMTHTQDITMSTKGKNATHHWDVVHRCKKCGTCPYIDTHDFEEFTKNRAPHVYNQKQVKRLSNGNTIVVDACICGKEKP